MSILFCTQTKQADDYRNENYLHAQNYKMILLMNIIIALAGFVGIIAARKLSRQTERMDFKNHFVILGIKVVFISAIVTLFCLSTEKNSHAILILTGLLNLIVFHFTEAFVIQRKLINNRNTNV